MGGFTSALGLNTNTILQALSQSWMNPINSAQAKMRLQEYYPQTNLPDYDQYYAFPKESLVCIKVETSGLLSVDCYHSDVVKCSIDFSDALRRLSQVQKYDIDNLGYDPGKSSWSGSLVSALYPGGVILFIAGLAAASIGILGSLVIVFVYVAVYAYLKRGNRI
ncbi:MAG: hypothetical protein KGI38_02415 [Thaumarchaeota archaeon]|nr:hypothetical protein [Nitrososphaerota archaeon]